METNFVIDRSRWRTGEGGEHKTGSGETSLLNGHGYMCCLGFACLNQGLSEDQIRNIGEPGEVKHHSDFWEESTYPEAEYLIDNCGGNTQLSNKAMVINDNEDTTPEEKEALLIELFTEYTDGKFVPLFVGEYHVEK